MEKRQRINERIVNWIKNKVEKEYADDISLVLVYGSYINGTANDKSDVDCYYIPKTERGYQFAATFIIDGVGYDIFPMSWERVEGIADLNEFLTPLVGDVQIIYSCDEKEKERFRILQNKLKRNLLDDKYVKRIAKIRCEMASELCSAMKASHSACEIRKMAGTVIMLLADAVAIYNHDYFHYGLKKQYENLRDNFVEIPAEIINGYKDVIIAANADESVNCTMKMFSDVCEYLNLQIGIPKTCPKENAAVNNADASWLAELYGEIISTFNKIYVCCENKNYILAFLSAVCLQRDLDDEAGCSFDLLGDFDYLHLDRLAEKTRKTENEFVQLIEKNGGRIKKFESVEQFEMSLYSQKCKGLFG